MMSFEMTMLTRVIAAWFIATLLAGFMIWLIKQDAG